MFPGRKLVTFAPVLKYETFPLAEITQSLLAPPSATACTAACTTSYTSSPMRSSPRGPR